MKEPIKTEQDWEKEFDKMFLQRRSGELYDKELWEVEKELRKFIRQTIQADRQKTIEWIKQNFNEKTSIFDLINYLKR